MRPVKGQSTVELLTPGPFAAGNQSYLEFSYRPSGPLPSGSTLWMFFDIRQAPGIPQHGDASALNHISAEVSSERPVACQAYQARTLDLYPRLPEFLHVCEMCFGEGLSGEDVVSIRLGSRKRGWRLPRHPIDPFRFWFLESPSPDMRFSPTGYKTYRVFNTDQPEVLQARLAEIKIAVDGEYPRPSPSHIRETPGILWGDIHGMAFNQRPLDDFYYYARDVARFDFAAAMLFGYNVCIDGIWQQVKDTARRWTELGSFLAIVGVENDTVPDGSHRNAYFFEPESVPPICCSERAPAREARFTHRFCRDAVCCDSLDDYYSTIKRFNGIVTGHFHTWDYEQEILAEIWQKQLGGEGDEARIFGLLNQGKQLGIVAGSDTHDSMPGNPLPEPYGCAETAGFMAVLAEEVSSSAIRDAILARRVYGTTGARITLRFAAGERLMGSVLPANSLRNFEVRAEGAASLARVELLRNGKLLRQIEPNAPSTSVRWRDAAATGDCWYLVRVTQEDGHRGWSSPIWFTSEPPQAGVDD